MMLKIFIFIFLLQFNLFSKTFDISSLENVIKLDNIEYISDERK